MKLTFVLSASVACGVLCLGNVGHAADATPSASAALSPAADRKAIPPSRSELPDAAFRKLDVGGKGYVTRDDAREVEGFDAIFQQSDANHDGRLTPDEFRRAWTAYADRQ